MHIVLLLRNQRALEIRGNCTSNVCVKFVKLRCSSAPDLTEQGKGRFAALLVLSMNGCFVTFVCSCGVGSTEKADEARTKNLWVFPILTDFVNRLVRICFFITAVFFICSAVCWGRLAKLLHITLLCRLLFDYLPNVRDHSVAQTTQWPAPPRHATLQPRYLHNNKLFAGALA